MVTVSEMIKVLQTMDPDHEVIIYPKYASDDVDGIRKHKFRADQICEQEPYAINIKHDKERLKGHDHKIESYEINPHVAILF